jgi:Homeodomain-like domain
VRIEPHRNMSSVLALTDDSHHVENQLFLRVMRRDDICIYVSAANRALLNAIIADRNSARKLAWRAEIVLATADGLGTAAIMRRTGKSKPCVWRWQERYMEEGVEGLKRDKTRPSRKLPLSAQTKLAVIKKTTTEKPGRRDPLERA